MNDAEDYLRKIGKVDSEKLSRIYSICLDTILEASKMNEWETFSPKQIIDLMSRINNA